MIRIQDPLGKTVLTNDFFVGLVSNAIKNCYGVAGMSARNPRDSVKTLIFGSEQQGKGVEVSEDEGALVITLHIKVDYGVNIGTIVDNVKEKVSYAVERMTNLKVNRINVCVDDIVTE